MSCFCIGSGNLKASLVESTWSAALGLIGIGFPKYDLLSDISKNFLVSFVILGYSVAYVNPYPMFDSLLPCWRGTFALMARVILLSVPNFGAFEKVLTTSELLFILKEI